MGERAQRKRFARAIDDEIARTDDEQLRTELDIVDQLRRAGTAPVTDQPTRNDIAARISAGTSRETPLEQHPTGRAPAGQRPPSTRRHGLRPRLAAALAVVVGLATLAVVFSAGSTPGDTLYVLKRARESTVLAFTFDERAAALKRLDYAAERVTELTELAESAAHTPRQAAPTGYRSNLADFETATRNATTTLTELGTDAGGKVVANLQNWTQRQKHRLHELRATLAPDIAHQQTSTAMLLRRIEQRTTALQQRFDCYRITTGTTDNLGPVPATGECRDSASRSVTHNRPDTADTPAEPAPRSPSPTAPKSSKQPPADTATGDDAPRQRTADTPKRPPQSSARHHREPYDPEPATPEPPPNVPDRKPGGIDSGQSTEQPPDLLRPLDELLAGILPATGNKP